MFSRKLITIFALIFVLATASVYLVWQINEDVQNEDELVGDIVTKITLLEEVRKAQNQEAIPTEQLLSDILGNQLQETHQAACGNASVTDIQGHMYEKDINALIKNCIVSGYADGTYRPNAQINRAELAKIVMGAFFSIEELSGAINYFQGQGLSYAGLPDVPLGEWYAPYIALGMLEEIIKGYLGETVVVNGVKDHPFKPGNPVTFGEAFKILLTAKITVTDAKTRQAIENELFYASGNSEALPNVPQDDWTRPYVIAGTSSNLSYMFPGAFVGLRHTPITRSQFAHLAVNVMSY